MAPKGSRPCCSPCQNFPPLDLVEDELAKKPGPVWGSYSGNTSPALFCNPTPGPKLVPALNPAPVPAPAPFSFNKLFKQFMRAYLESNQGPRQPLAERKQFLKAKVPEIYYGKSHMDCYQFCQQYEDHFDTVGATGNNQTLFAAFFLRENISVRWTQYKRRHQGEELTSIIWTEFKAFLWKNLGESKSFVDNIWSKLKRDSQYQLEEVYNWASHLEYFQSILMEFNPAAAPTESTMVRYFEEDLKPSIKAEIDQDATHLDDYEELVSKAVRVEVKAGLQLSFYVHKTDIQVL